MKQSTEGTAFGSAEDEPLKSPSFIKRRSSLTGSLLGNYEESILNGRLSTPPSASIDFLCQISALSSTSSIALKPISIPFKAQFYRITSSASFGSGSVATNTSIRHRSLSDSTGAHINADQLAASFNRRMSLQSSLPFVEEVGTPYIGTIDLSQPIQIPFQGKLQIIIRNMDKSVVKVFLISYDYSGLSVGNRSFLRHKIYAKPKDPDAMPGVKDSLRYAVCLQFVCGSNEDGKKKRLYITKNIRAVFSNRVISDQEEYRVVYDSV